MNYNVISYSNIYFLDKNALVMTVSTHSIQLAGGGAHKVINMRTHKQSQTLEIQNQL